MEDILIDLPEYDIRRLAAARDPLAVVEAHRLNVCLRLAWLLGARMCPECPRCNASDHGWGCQDLFGCNLRPTGGIIGGMPAFACGNAHQGHGTPHAHGQAHVVCIYQYASLREIAERIDKGLRLTKDVGLVEDMRKFQEWFHVESPLHAAGHEAYADEAEAQFFDSLRERQHSPLCVTPGFLQEDADDLEKETQAAAYKDGRKLEGLQEEGRRFAQDYREHAQFVFSRVQHHVHK